MGRNQPSSGQNDPEMFVVRPKSPGVGHFGHAGFIPEFQTLNEEESLDQSVDGEKNSVPKPRSCLNVTDGTHLSHTSATRTSIPYTG